jgi:hypothetical protein
MLVTSDALIGGLLGNEAAIAWVLIVAGAIFVTAFVVTWIALVRRGSNREWPIR